MLGQPALVVRDGGGDAQRVALLAQERVAAVAGSVRPDRPLLREVRDVLRRVARPSDVVLTRLQGCAHGVHALDEVRVEAVDRLERLAAGAGHDAHREDDVGGVRDLDAEHGLLRVHVTHDEGDDVHRASAHRTGEDVLEDALHLCGRHPVVERAGVLLLLGADERAVLDAGDVVGVRRRVVGVRRRRQLDDGAGVDRLLEERLALVLVTGDPLDGVRGGALCDGADEVEDPGILRRRIHKQVFD